jgi:hypothetical protein
MGEDNQYGLSRHIPADVRRVVRQRCKFGCVICRRGFYQYEHIDPEFKDAKEHDPDRICCLCASCHDSVTRGQLSKGLVMNAYRKVKTQQAGEVGPPVGPLDFHDGSAELAIGGLQYNPAVQTILRYHGNDLIRVVPGQGGEPGKITAVFTDDDGKELLRLDENEWMGQMDNWDIEVVGKRLTVRKKEGEINLQLRLDPPGRIVAERLDMRVGSAHVLATEESYAVGRCFKSGLIGWCYADLRIRASTPLGTAIEFLDPSKLYDPSVATRFTGAMIQPLGIAIGSLCSALEIKLLAFGSCPLETARSAMRSHPKEFGELICRESRMTNLSILSATPPN